MRLQCTSHADVPLKFASLTLPRRLPKRVSYADEIEPIPAKRSAPCWSFNRCRHFGDRVCRWDRSDDLRCGGYDLGQSTLERFVLWPAEAVDWPRHLRCIAMSLEHWVNDGLMAIFFLLVGLEIKRELVLGELSSFRRAAFPIGGAIGGMVVPALLYVAFNSTAPGARGLGHPDGDRHRVRRRRARAGRRRCRPPSRYSCSRSRSWTTWARCWSSRYFTRANLRFPPLRAAGDLPRRADLAEHARVRVRALPVARHRALGGDAEQRHPRHDRRSAVGVHDPGDSSIRRNAVSCISCADAYSTISDRDADAHPEQITENQSYALKSMEEASQAVQTPLAQVEHALLKPVAFGIIPIFALANAGDCAALIADFMLRMSDLHSQTCGVCAEACQRCA